MRTFLQFIFLTGVVTILSSHGLAEENSGKTEGLCAQELAAEAKARGLLDDFKGDREKDPNHSRLERNWNDASRRLSDCKSDKKNSCDELKKERKEITDKFPVSSQTKAINCLYADDTQEDGSILKSIMFAAAGQTPPGRKQCSLGGTKSNQKDDIEKYDKKIKEYEDEIKDANEDLVKIDKRLKEDISDLQDARLKLKDAWEKTQEGAEDARDKALQQMQDNQIKITDEIRKSQSQLLKARQDANKIDIELKKALTKSNVQTEGSMLRTCNLRLREYVKKLNETSGSSKKSYTSLSSAGSRGKAKMKDRQDMFDQCMKEQRELRSEIFQNFTDAAVQMAKYITDIEQQIVQLEDQYKKQVEDYNKALQKLQLRLPKEQQKYYQEDQMIAQKILDAQQNAQLDQARLNENKMKAQQKMAGAYNSQGALSTEEAEDALEHYERLEEVDASLENNCGVKGPSSLRRSEMREKIEDIRDRSSSQ